MRNVRAEYVGHVVVHDPELPEGERDADDKELHVWKNPETGTLVAIDNMELPAERNSIIDPYDESVRLVFSDTFSGLPK